MAWPAAMIAALCLTTGLAACARDGDGAARTGDSARRPEGVDAQRADVGLEPLAACYKDLAEGCAAEG
jgi:hypothetical protein